MRQIPNTQKPDKIKRSHVQDCEVGLEHTQLSSKQRQLSLTYLLQLTLLNVTGAIDGKSGSQSEKCKSNRADWLSGYNGNTVLGFLTGRNIMEI